LTEGPWSKTEPSETKGDPSSTEKRTRYCWPTVPGGLGMPYRAIAQFKGPEVAVGSSRPAMSGMKETV
jgi:hypothetical protein